MFQFTVKRSQWYRGSGPGRSRLLIENSARDEEPSMCCLGFAALACGYSALDILDVASPARIYDPELDAPRGFFGYLVEADASEINTDLAQYLMEINDERKLSEIERECRLTILFASIGVEVTFED